MYTYVPKAEIDICRKFCNVRLNALIERLREDNIIAYYNLIGSGANNMVVCKNNQPFDLDYNIIFTKLPKEYDDNPERLKIMVTNRLNSIMHWYYKCGQDSTSAITYNPILVSSECHKIDIGLIKRIKPSLPYSRLIHDKPNGKFFWNEIRNSDNIKIKVKSINRSGLNLKLRKIYKEKKEIYYNDQNHPSFVVYIEAVNQVFQFVRKEDRKMAKVSGNTHTKGQMNSYANQNNQNNYAHKAARDNHANQCNPNNKEYKGRK